MSVDRWRHQEVVFQRAGQVLCYDPAEGRPSGTPAVTVIRAGSGRPEPATIGACSVDGTTIALARAVSPGTTALVLAEAPGIMRGHRYLLGGGEGEHEWIEVRAVDGTAVTTRRPLLHGHGIGSTVVGCRISIALDPSWTADPSKLTDAPNALDRELAGYRLSWTYTVDGVARSGVSSVDLVRRAAHELVTPLDVDERFPGWLDRLSGEHRDDQGAGLILEAFAAVKLDALGDGYAMYRVRDTEVLCELVKLRANLMAVEHDALFGRATAHELAVAEERYDARRVQLLREPGGDAARGALMR